MVDKRSTLQENIKTFGDGGVPPPGVKYRVGTFVVNLFDEHINAYDQKRPNGEHRPLSPYSMGYWMWDMNKPAPSDFGRRGDSLATGGYFDPHIHFMLMLPGTKYKDMDKGSDDVVLRFDPFKVADLADPSTATGIQVKKLMFTGHSVKQNFPADIASMDLKETLLHTQENFVASKEKSYFENDFFSSKIKIVGDEEYFIPNPEKYPHVHIREHKEMTIEHPADVTPRMRAIEKGNDDYIIEFEKDGQVVGGYTLKAEGMTPESIKFKQVDYSTYSALERGEVDINTVDAYSQFIYKNEEKATGKPVSEERPDIFDIFKKEKMQDLNRRQVLRFKGWLLVFQDELGNMKDFAAKQNLTAQVEAYERLEKIVRTVDEKIKYGDGQTHVGALKKELQQKLEEINVNKFQDFKTRQKEWELQVPSSPVPSVNPL
jgi:hypothetical protein